MMEVDPFYGSWYSSNSFIEHMYCRLSLQEEKKKSYLIEIKKIEWEDSLVIMVKLSCISIRNFTLQSKIMSGISLGSKQTYGTSNSVIDLISFE
jgi:hypothetical protein